MRRNSNFLFRAFLVAAIIGLGCGTKFDRSEIKGKLAEPLEADKVTKVKAMPNKKAKDLSATEQDELADIIFTFLHDKLDFMKTAKAVCHQAALEEEKSQCEKTRDECLKQVAQLNVADLKKKLKADESIIKEFVKKSDHTPKAYMNAIELLNFGLEKISGIDCGFTDAQKEKVLEDAQKQLAAKFSTQEIEDAAQVLEKLLQYATSVEVEAKN